MGAYLRPFRRMGTMGTGNRDLVAPPLVRFLKNDKMDTVPSASDPEPEFSPGMGRGAVDYRHDLGASVQSCFAVISRQLGPLRTKRTKRYRYFLQKNS